MTWKLGDTVVKVSRETWMRSKREVEENPELALYCTLVQNKRFWGTVISLSEAQARGCIPLREWPNA